MIAPCLGKRHNYQRADCIPCKSGRQEGFRGWPKKLLRVFQRASTDCGATDFRQPPMLESHPNLSRRHFIRRLKWVRGNNMLWTLFVVLLVLWLLGVVSSYTMGGFIHILLVLALVALVFQLVSGRRTTI